MNNMNDNRSYSGLVEKYIGTAYDKVAAVASQLDEISQVNEIVDDGRLDKIISMEGNITLAAALINFKGSWDRATSYLVGESVSHAGMLWIVNQDNMGSEPAFNSADWYHIIENNTLSIDILEDLVRLPAIVNTAIVKGDHDENYGGVGIWNWDPYMDRARADLGTIIDPTVPLTIAEQGHNTGYGCWIRMRDTHEVHVTWFMVNNPTHLSNDAFLAFIAAEGRNHIINGYFTCDDMLMIHKSGITLDIFGCLTGPGRPRANPMFMVAYAPVAIENITINNHGTLDLNGSGYGVGSSLIYVGHPKDTSTIFHKNIIIRNYGLMTGGMVGINLNNCHGFTIDPVGKIFECETDGIVVGNGSSNGVINNGEIYKCGHGGQGILLGASYTTVSNIHIHGFDPSKPQIQRGITFGHSGDSQANASMAHNCSVINCVIEDLCPPATTWNAVSSAIFLKAGMADNAIINGNHLFRTNTTPRLGAAIFIDTDYGTALALGNKLEIGAVISNNYIKGGFADGIRLLNRTNQGSKVYVKGIIISDNKIDIGEFKDSAGIRVYHAESTLVTGNYITGATYGLFIQTPNNIITNNHIEASSDKQACVFYKNPDCVNNLLSGNILMHSKKLFVAAYLTSLAKQHDINNPKNGVII